MVLRVKPTPTRFPTNSLYTPMDNTPLHSIPSVCHPWGVQSANDRRNKVNDYGPDTGTLGDSVRYKVG